MNYLKAALAVGVTVAIIGAAYAALSWLSRLAARASRNRHAAERNRIQRNRERGLRRLAEDDDIDAAKGLDELVRRRRGDSKP